MKFPTEYAEGNRPSGRVLYGKKHEEDENFGVLEGKEVEKE